MMNNLFKMAISQLDRFIIVIPWLERGIQKIKSSRSDSNPQSLLTAIEKLSSFSSGQPI